ncbi:MAG TPA: hypothetical protein VNQ73_20470 [Ilumatobacter sp.]|nr:hypothetical protein [Ilumatobacter sp.]
MSSNLAFHVDPIRHPAARPYDAEWRRLRCNPAALRRAATWRVVRTDVTTLDDVLAATGYGRPPSAGAEANLRFVVCAAADDPVAAQVVMRRLLPGALSVATRHRRRVGADALDELLGALWITVRTFDPSRRPASLAAALLADAEHRAFRQRSRRMLCEVPGHDVSELPVPNHDADNGDDHVDPADELAALVDRAAASGLADSDDIALLRLLLVEPSPMRLARHLNVTERTVRNRRARVAAKLRAAALAA